MKRIICMGMMMVGLVACAAPNTKDYDAVAQCQGLGLQPGTHEYDQCLIDQRNSRLMEEQRQEYERMKQDEQDWKMRRY